MCSGQPRELWLHCVSAPCDLPHQGEPLGHTAGLADATLLGGALSVLPQACYAHLSLTSMLGWRPPASSHRPHTVCLPLVVLGFATTLPWLHQGNPRLRWFRVPLLTLWHGPARHGTGRRPDQNAQTPPPGHGSARFGLGGSRVCHHPSSVAPLGKSTWSTRPHQLPPLKHYVRRNTPRYQRRQGAGRQTPHRTAACRLIFNRVTNS